MTTACRWSFWVFLTALGCSSPAPQPPGSPPAPADARPPISEDAEPADADPVAMDSTVSDGTLLDSATPDASCTPEPEICDGVDNDCDPETADGSDAPCMSPSGARGRCAGTMGCVWECIEGYADCNLREDDGCEVNLPTDENHCGACEAACPMGFSCDAGSCRPPPIVIDGVINESEWAGAVTASSARTTTWGTGLNELRGLRARIDRMGLNIAIEGVVESTNAIIVYVDSTPMTGVCDLFTLSDGIGLVDDPLSAGLATPADFCADYGWATRGMSRVGVALEDGIGWRDLNRTPSDFSWFDASVAPSHCTASACETRLPASSLSLAPGATARVFVRLGNAVGTAFANQTLPEDSGESPAVVTRTLIVPAP